MVRVCRTLHRVARRFHEWLTEVPGIVSGLLILSRPLRKETMVLLLMNAVLAGWEAIQPLIFKLGVDSLPGVPLIQVAAVVLASIFFIEAPHGMLLPFMRDFYLVSRFRPYFERHVSLLCLQKGVGVIDPEVKSREAPIAQEGRAVTLQLTEMLFRDSVFVLRGLVLLSILGYISPLLFTVVFCGMLAELFVVVFMDEVLVTPNAQRIEAMLQVREAEFVAFDPSHHRREVTVVRCQDQWREYIRAFRYAETRRLTYQLLIRGSITLTWKMIAMLIVGSWVAERSATPGDYAFFIPLCLKASDPLVVLVTVQQSVMTSRESLRRLGLLVGIDFGIDRPSRRKFTMAPLSR